MDKEQYAKYRYEKKFVTYRIEEQIQKTVLKAQRAEEARKLIEGEISEVLLPSKGSKEGGEGLEEEGVEKGEYEEGGEGHEMGEGGEGVQQEKESKVEKAPSNESVDGEKEQSQEAFYSDEYDVPPDMINVIKAAEIVYKPVEVIKPEKKGGKGKKGKKEKPKKGKKGGKAEAKPKEEPPPPPEPPVEVVRERKPEREVEESQEGEKSEAEDKGGDSKLVASKTSVPKSENEITSEAGDSAAPDEYGADEGSEYEDEDGEEEDEGEGEEAAASMEDKKDEDKDAAKAREEEEIAEVVKSEMEILSIHGSILSVMEHVLEGLFVLFYIILPYLPKTMLYLYQEEII